jgi:hypothetical protein
MLEENRINPIPRVVKIGNLLFLFREGTLRQHQLESEKR